MLYRIWFALSVAWAGLVIVPNVLTGYFFDDPRKWLAVGLSPFVLGAIVRSVVRWAAGSGPLQKMRPWQ